MLRISSTLRTYHWNPNEPASASWLLLPASRKNTKYINPRRALSVHCIPPISTNILCYILHYVHTWRCRVVWTPERISPPQRIQHQRVLVARPSEHQTVAAADTPQTRRRRRRKNYNHEHRDGNSRAYARVNTREMQACSLVLWWCRWTTTATAASTTTTTTTMQADFIMFSCRHRSNRSSEKPTRLAAAAPARVPATATLIRYIYINCWTYKWPCVPDTAQSPDYSTERNERVGRSSSLWDGMAGVHVRMY